MSETRVLSPAGANLRPAQEAKQNSVILDARFRQRLPAETRDFVLDVAFQATPGFTILFGASGAGKTTLLDSVAGLTTPDEGRIALGKCLLFDASRRVSLPVAKRHV